MDPRGSTEVGDVLGADLGGEDVTVVRPGVEHVIDEDVGRPGDELLGHRLVGGQERPHPESQAEVHVRAPKCLAGGDDVEHGETADGAWGVQCHSVGAACATVVSDGAEVVEPERVHDFELVTGDLAHAVRRVVGRARRRAAVAEAAKVGGDNREPLDEARRLGDAMEQENRRPLPPRRPWMVVPVVAMSNTSKLSNTSQGPSDRRECATPALLRRAPPRRRRTRLPALPPRAPRSPGPTRRCGGSCARRTRSTTTSTPS
jgi:hypothetical protein